MAEVSFAWLLSFAWLSVTVKRGTTTVIPRKIVKIGWDNVFGELLTAANPDLHLVKSLLGFPSQRTSGLLILCALGKIDTVLHVTIFFTIEK